MQASKADEFEKDEGWKSVEEEEQYTDDELAEFEQQLQEEEKLKMAQKEAINTAQMIAAGHLPPVSLISIGAGILILLLQHLKQLSKYLV